jgi:putative FmdB family regulatory protein
MTYEYVCEACGHQWEAEQSIKDSPLKTCVSCAENKAKRLVSGGTGSLLKGGCWYADLYGSPGSAKSAGDDKGGKAATASTKSESSESKPATGDSKPAADTKAASPATSTPAASPSGPAPSPASAKAS